MRNLPHRPPSIPSPPTPARLPRALSSTTGAPTSTTAASQPSRTRKPATTKPTLTLEHFLLRQRVLGLYRTIARALAALPRDSAQRRELRAYARAEFERHRAVTDAGKIRYLVSTGKTEFDSMSRYVGEMGRR